MEINLKIPSKVHITKEVFLFKKNADFTLYRPTQAWQWMNQTRSIPNAIDWVRADVSESWRRCLEDHQLPLGKNIQQESSLSGNQLNKLDNRIEHIAVFIKMLSSNFHVFLKEANAVLILTNSDGKFLCQIGEPTFQNIFIEKNCQKNADWQEAVLGNNGIGSTITLNRPIAFQGMEHYSSALHPFTTVGYPLVDEQGKLLAVLGLVSHHQESMSSLFAFLHLICVLVNTNLPLDQKKVAVERELIKKEMPSSVSDELQVLVKKAVKLQKYKVPILITGESGVGKDHFVGLIKEAGPRAKKPLIAINCASIPRELIESELFGYAAGSFTGAKKEGKPGKFMLANEGILFLDEIGDMSIDLQSTLLRVLETSEFTPVGGMQSVKVDVQVIAATHVDLLAAVEAGKFRQDLYYRLNGMKIHLPSLRDCLDKKQIIQHILQRELKTLSDKSISVCPQVIVLLESYRWPGNIRQLINVIRYMIYTSTNSLITENDLPEEILFTKIKNTSKSNQSIKDNAVMSLAEWEVYGIKIALNETKGNISLAAKKLGITRTTLYKKIERFGLDKQGDEMVFI